MKRFLLLIFVLLLVLPCLVVPSLAAPASIVVDGTVVDSSVCSFDVIGVPAGSYFLTLSAPMAGDIAYTPDPVYFSGADSSFDIYSCSDLLGSCIGLPSQIVSGQLLVANVLELPSGMPLILTFVPAADLSLFSDFFTIASSVIDWVGQIAVAIVDHPFLLITVGIFFVGGCIAIFSRFLSRD